MIGAVIIPITTRKIIPEYKAYKPANNFPEYVLGISTGPIPLNNIDAFIKESIQLR